MPLPEETVCRLAKIVGLRLEDIDLENDLIHIRPNPARRLKNKTNERAMPLVDCTRTAMDKTLIHADNQWLFPSIAEQVIAIPHTPLSPSARGSRRTLEVHSA